MFDESFEHVWRQRFGEGPAYAEPSLARFLCHRSVRRYSDRPVPEGLVASLVGAAQSASTSSTLQLWSVVSVQDAENRAKVARLCADQRHVAEAPWFFAFLADHARLRRAAHAVGEEALGLDYTEFLVMAVIDACIAAERLVCAAESQGLGVCYIGALRNDVYGVKELLGLPAGVVGLFGICLGYPEEGPLPEVKPRLDPSSVWFRERYPEETDVSDYDRRMTAYYERHKMKGDVTWSMRSGRRVDEHHLTGREALRRFLTDQGLGLR